MLSYTGEPRFTMQINSFAKFEKYNGLFLLFKKLINYIKLIPDYYENNLIDKFKTTFKNT